MFSEGFVNMLYTVLSVLVIPPSRGQHTHPLSLNGLNARISMMRAVFVWFCTIQSVVNNFVSIVNVLNSTMVLYIYLHSV